MDQENAGLRSGANMKVQEGLSTVNRKGATCKDQS